MELHTFYRLCKKEGAAQRPEWYSKQKCWEKLEWQCFSAGVPHPIVLCDGEFPDWFSCKESDAVQLNNVDKSESFWQSYLMAIECPDLDWIYFSEDDYILVPGAIEKLAHCIEDVGPDLISLYDHPDRYRDLPEHNLTQHKNDIFISRDHHWRTVPSTCMTFACSVAVLKAERALFEKYKHIDFNLFPALLGLREDDIRPGRPYLMVGAIPSLATHCQEGYLAPNVDWQKIAAGER